MNVSGIGGSSAPLDQWIESSLSSQEELIGNDPAISMLDRPDPGLLADGLKPEWLEGAIERFREILKIKESPPEPLPVGVPIPNDDGGFDGWRPEMSVSPEMSTPGLSEQQAHSWVDSLLANQQIRYSDNYHGKFAAIVRDSLAMIAQTSSGRATLKHIFGSQDSPRDVLLNVNVDNTTEGPNISTGALYPGMPGNKPTMILTLDERMIDKECWVHSQTDPAKRPTQVANTTLILYHELVHGSQALAVKDGAISELTDAGVLALENSAVAATDVLAAELEVVNGEPLGQRKTYVNTTISCQKRDFSHP